MLRPFWEGVLEAKCDTVSTLERSDAGWCLVAPVQHVVLSVIDV